MISMDDREDILKALIERAWAAHYRDLMDTALRATRLIGQTEGIDIAVKKMHPTLIVNPEKIE